MLGRIIGDKAGESCLVSDSWRPAAAAKLRQLSQIAGVAHHRSGGQYQQSAKVGGAVPPHRAIAQGPLSSGGLVDRLERAIWLKLSTLFRSWTAES